jgi:rubrerythrin
MKKNEGLFSFALVIMIAFGVTMMGPALSSAGEAKASTTLENLQTAFNGESNAQAKYLAYAKKATEEGYLKVAGLFRAAAAAEEIHLNNHAEVIKSMGATPKAEITLPAINSTKENLADAIKGETYEQTVMYPDFLAQAEKEKNEDAMQTFNYAKAAEGEHAKLYQKALSNLNDWKVADVGFFVCPICGYTVEGKPTFKNCPVCATPANDYKLAS